VCSGVRLASCGVRGLHWRGWRIRFRAGSLHLCKGGGELGVVAAL
jgi:hypothetical protein